MNVGVISDLHSNEVALDAVLGDLPDVDALVCAGDVVGYNPWPAECVEEIRDRGIPTVMGNHDRMVAQDTNFGANSMAQAGIRLAHDRLSDGQVEWIRTLPPERTLFDDRLKVVHGHPDDPDRYTYPDQFAEEMLGDELALVMGHTHVQGHEVFDDGVVLNPGSVGQPRDRDPKAAYSVLDLDALTVEEHRVEYDVDRVVEAIQEAGLPRDTGERLRFGR
jgi:putative phosphoesterase